MTVAKGARALRRKERERQISALGVQRAWAMFQAHASLEYTLLAVSATVLQEAERLILNHKLRAFKHPLARKDKQPRLTPTSFDKAKRLDPS